MTLLHIDASIQAADSASRQLSAAVIGRLRADNPGLDVVYRDLAAHPLAHLSSHDLAARRGEAPQSPAAREDVAESQAVLQEFLDAKTVVIGAPMYNFTIPSQLKAWIDRVLVAGKTFRYTTGGVEGLAGDKRVIIAISRGGFYGTGTPLVAIEHVETYLRGIFGFVGVTDPEFIVAEGMLAGPEIRARGLRSALEAVTALGVA